MRRSVIGLVFASAGFFVVVNPGGAQNAAKADAKPAGTQAGDGRKTLTHDELVAMLGSGVHRMESVSEAGTHYTLELKPDGTFVGEYGARRRQERADPGKWEIKENQLCVQFFRARQGRERCLGAIVKSHSGEYYFEDGRLITFSQ